MKKPLVILTGPTAVGKTELSIQLAKAMNGEIISADSMQVYKHMDIGTAKISPSDMDGVKHHLIDILEPTQEFDVVKFQKYALDAMNEIYQKNKIPIIVGGTGFYIQALLYLIDFKETNEDSSFRRNLEFIAKEKGNMYLHSKLIEVDPESAKIIHPNNVKRVIRALEYYKKTGNKISTHNKEQRQKESPFQFSYFVLTNERKVLYDRINLRVDKMIEEGLVEEVKYLLSIGCTKEMVSMQGLGYKEIIPYLEGEYSLEEAIYLLKRDTRHFAKRQLTWFKREEKVTWIHKGELDNDESLVLNRILKELRMER